MQWFMALAALAGALHVLAPDHWVPASILSWQRGWRPGRSLAFWNAALAAHIGLGAAIFFAFQDLVFQLRAQRLFTISLLLIAVIAVFRAARFRRIAEVFRFSRSGLWGVFTVISLLGPCESIVPVLIKSHSLNHGYILPLLAFWLGSAFTGSVFLLLGREIWNRPLWLPLGIGLANRRGSALPIAVCLMVGLSFLLKLRV